MFTDGTNFEIAYVTGGQGTTTLTLQRAAELIGGTQTALSSVPSGTTFYAVATAAGLQPASYDTTVLTKLSLAPVAYWKLNDPVGSTTAADSSGNGYTLSVNGTVTFGEPSVVPSDSETSAQGDGSTGYLESSGVPSLIPTGAPMTIIACVAQGASAASGSIVGYGTSAMLSLQTGQLQWNLTSPDYAKATDAIASSPLLLVARMTALTAQLNANGSPVTGIALAASAVGSGPAYIFSWGSGGQYGSQPVGRVAFFAGLLTPKDEALLMQAFTGVS